MRSVFNIPLLFIFTTMNDMMSYLGIGLLFGGLGTVIGLYIARLKSKGNTSGLEERLKGEQQQLVMLKDAFAKAETEREELRQKKDFLQNELTARNVAFSELEKRIEEKHQELEKLQEKFTKDFELVANKILDEKSNKFTVQNQENLDKILKPFKEKIQHFEKKVEETNKEAIDRTSALREQIKNLTALNEQMSKEAHNLTKALKGDSKMQGNWGELVLERVLEKSGLEKDREYFVQQSFTREDGQRVLPDVIIHLPDGKKMVIDSKVSLTAYERYANAEDGQLREIALKEHVTSLKRHVSQLSEKNYQDLYEIESPDFVLLFVPIEPAFAVAINTETAIYNQAFEKNIVIVTPSTLLATLRTIDSMWNNEKQQRNAMEIARQAGALYDKFHGLMSDLTTVGKKMDDAKSGYESAMNKLVSGRGNLINSVEKLKKMGAKAKKALPDPLLRRSDEEEDH